MYTDPIADYLLETLWLQTTKLLKFLSNLKKEITKILFDQGYILSYKFEDNAVQGSIKIALKYDKDTKESVIKISKELVNQVYVNIQVLRPFQESLMD
jgi:small subunit ribosomal protein S8